MGVCVLQWPGSPPMAWPFCPGCPPALAVCCLSFIPQHYVLMSGRMINVYWNPPGFVKMYGETAAWLQLMCSDSLSIDLLSCKWKAANFVSTIQQRKRRDFLQGNRELKSTRDSYLDIKREQHALLFSKLSIIYRLVHEMKAKLC